MIDLCVGSFNVGNIAYEMKCFVEKMAAIAGALAHNLNKIVY